MPFLFPKIFTQKNVGALDKHARVMLSLLRRVAKTR